MTLLTTIKAAQLTARKNRESDVVSSLTTLIGDAEAIGKKALRETTDAEVVALLKKYIGNVTATIDVVQKTGDTAKITQLTTERELFERFLPQQLTEAELREIISVIFIGRSSSVPESKPKMGDMIAALKIQHEGAYDTRKAAELIKEVLA